MKKNGFVFVESIVVLVVVALSIAMLISSYSLVTRKTKEKEYYNKTSDKYLLYAISNLGTDDICNYSKWCNSVGGSTFKYPSGNNITFRADADQKSKFACTSSKLGKILADCNEVFKEMNIVSIYVVDDIVRELHQNNTETLEFYDSGTLEYMKSLNKCRDLTYTVSSTTCSDPIKYMIGVFERENGDLHYASIEI